jgi:hypothetical protein
MSWDDARSELTAALRRAGHSIVQRPREKGGLCVAKCERCKMYYGVKSGQHPANVPPCPCAYKKDAREDPDGCG